MYGNPRRLSISRLNGHEGAPGWEYTQDRIMETSLLSVAVFWCALAGLAEDRRPPVPGDVASDFKLLGDSAKKVTLYDYRGKQNGIVVFARRSNRIVFARRGDFTRSGGGIKVSL